MGAQPGFPGSSILAAKFTNHATGELGEALFGEPGTALGSVFGVQLVAVVESWGQEPLALT